MASRSITVDGLIAERTRRRAIRVGFSIGLLLLVAWSIQATIIADTDWHRLGSFGDVMRAIGRFVGIDWSLIPHLVVPMLETFMMACLGTLLGCVISLPVAWLGAINVTPNKFIFYPIGRFLMTLSRSTHEIVWALIFVSAVGLGSLPGILALACRSVGFISKISAEAIENIDHKPVEAIRAVGGNNFQVMYYGIIPQVLPVVLGTVVFEWDINIRRSAIMGLVGAGGLGLTFHRQMVMYNYPGVTTVILAILALIAVGEVFSHRARKAVT